MTDIVSRQATPVEQLSPADQSAGLDIQLRRAEAIASATGMLPPAYANKPGAILLAEQWGAGRGIDLLTTMQSVSFVKGKPVVDATMLRALTEAAGYSYEIDTDDKTYATFTLNRPEWAAPKSATFTHGDAADANLLAKDNWKGYLGDMLVARATTRCLRRHAPGVMVGIFIRDEVDEPFEAQLSQTASSREDPVDVLIPPESDDEAEVVDAEIVEEVADTGSNAGPVGEPSPPPEPDKRTVEDISGDPRDAVFDTPPATTMPAPAAEPDEAKAFEPVDPATFKAMLNAKTKWNSIRLLKELANVGESNITLDQVCEDERLYSIATAIIQNPPT